ncbi:MAG TPA: TIGR04282 family arsenosugar biosynthesis glycosyltransferase [Gammaproteobacteria bacterium]
MPDKKPTSQQLLIVFAKAPVEAQCKTRLIPLLGESGATKFYKDLLQHCLLTVSQLDNTDIALYVTPHTQHPFLQQLVSDYHTILQLQQGRDLGERMHHAMQQGLQDYQRVVLIGSDCPGITPGYLERAFATLQHSDLVIGPAKDGGYVLIGGQRISAEIFANTRWSSEQVFEQCLRNIHHAGYSHQCLAPQQDIDTPEDFLHNQLQLQTLLGKTYPLS